MSIVMDSIQTLTAGEISLIDGGSAASDFALAAGALSAGCWLGAEIAVAIPGGQGAAAFLGMGAAVCAVGAAGGAIAAAHGY